MIKRIIPSSGETLPVIGLGTYQTFDVTPGTPHLKLSEVLNGFYNAGGRLLDSSPMYGNAETIIGEVTAKHHDKNNFFYATKVWTTGRKEGIAQMESSIEKMRCDVVDLIQIHNLVDWQTHLETLKQWKSEGKVRYIGITHYTDEMHEELERLISTGEFDFVQFNYSITARNAEKRLLPAAKDHGVATLINRPLAVGKLFDSVAGKSLPPWAAEADITSWADYFLKYIIAHPAVTCVIPATGNPDHMKDNLVAGEGLLPDETMRQKMVKWITEF